jgi:hypothetical protein
MIMISLDSPVPAIEHPTGAVHAAAQFRTAQDAVGVCLVGFSQTGGSSIVSPVIDSSTIVNWRPEYRGPSAFPFDGATAHLLKAPSHGTLSPDPKVPDYYGYVPAAGYVRPDRDVFLVTLPAVPGASPGRTVRVVYFIKSVGHVSPSENPDTLQARRPALAQIHCPRRGRLLT